MSRNNRTTDRKPHVLPVVVFAICAGVAIAAVVALLSDKSKRQARVAPPPVAGTATAADLTAPELPPLPDDPVQLVNLGSEMLQRGYLTQATRVYLEALKKNPDDADVHFNLGFAYA